MENKEKQNHIHLTLEKQTIFMWMGLVVAVVLIIIVFSVASKKESSTYYFPKGSFSAYFPQQPTFKTDTQKLLSNGKDVIDNGYTLNDSDGNNELTATYVSSAFDFKNSKTPEQNLSNEVAYTITNNGGNLTSSNATTYNGLPAVDYVGCSTKSYTFQDVSGVTTHQWCITGRDILKGNDLYMFEYQYKSGEEDKTLENTFLNSVVFGEQPAGSIVVNPTTNNTTSTSSSTTTTQPSTAEPVPTVPAPQQPAAPPAVSDASGNLLPSVIRQIEPNIVEINCYSYDGNIESSGSGVSYIPKSMATNLIETNYHVYSGAIISGQAPTCYAVFPEPPNFSYNGYYGDYQLTLTAWHYNPNTYEDAAVFTLGSLFPSSVPLNPIPIMEDVYKNLGIPQNKHECSPSDVNVGDSVTIFGYPNSGNLLGISETVTEGIISGIVAGPIYKTNAAIDHGNSGGVAILNKNGCALGIPTLGASGLTSGIGYIQSYPLIDTVVCNSDSPNSCY